MMGKKKYFNLVIITLILSILSQGSINNLSTHAAPPADITLGGLFPLTGSLSGGGVEREAAFRMAIEEINLDPTILSATTLNYIVRDTQTDVTTGATVAQELLDLGVFGLVGAASSSVSKAVADKAKVAKKPQISYSSTNADLSDKTLYPYFLRVVAPDQIQGGALASILWDLNVSTVATLNSRDNYGQAGITVFKQNFTELGGKISVSPEFDTSSTDIRPQLLAIRNSDASVIVVNMIVNHAQTVLTQAAELGITKENGYQWVGSDGVTQEAVYSGNSVITDAMDGFIGLRQNFGGGPLYESFLDLWETCNGQTSAEYAGCGDRDPNTYATFAYDAVYAFARAADAMIIGGADPNDGELLLQELKGISFDGATGPISFSSNYDRLGLYDVFNLNATLLENVGNWDINSGLNLTKALHWAPPKLFKFPTVLDLGGLFPLSGSLAGGGVERDAAARMAIRQINNNPNILNNTLLNLVVRNTQTNPTVGGDVAQELLDLGVFGLVGAASSSVSTVVADKATIAKTPQISYSSSNPTLSDKTLYPYFLRVLPSETGETIALANVLWELNVTSVAVIYDSAIVFGAGRFSAFESEFTNLGGTMATSQTLSTGELDLSSQLSAIKATGTKTILVDAFPDDAIRVFTQAEELDMTINQNYQWVGPSVSAHDYAENDIMRKIQGMIGVSINLGEGPEHEAFLNLWQSCAGSTVAEYSGCGDRNPNQFAPFAYDAVYAFALAADAMIKAGLHPSNGDTLLTTLLNTDFDGTTGKVRFDSNGDRNALYNINNHNGVNFVDVGRWSDDGIIFTGTISWATDFSYEISTSSSTSSTIDVTTTTIVSTVSDKSEDDGSPAFVEFNFYWGIIGLIMIVRIRGINSKKKYILFSEK